MAQDSIQNTIPKYDRLDSVHTDESFVRNYNLGKASILSSIVNLCNSIVGAALLGLPYAASQVGWITSIIMLILFSIVSAWTFQMETTSGITFNLTTRTLSSSYYSLSKATNIPKLEILADLTIFVNTFGSICAYLVIIGDLMPDAMDKYIDNENSIFLKRRCWIILYMSVFIIPCSILKKLDFLRFTSLFAMICFVFITISMIVFYEDSSVNLCNKDLTNNKECGLEEFINLNDNEHLLNFFKATPIYMFAFGTHPLAFTLTNELLHSNDFRMNIVVILSFLITTIYYVCIGVLGYWTFGTHVHSNILNDYPTDSLLLFCVRIGLSIALAFSYPVVVTPSRHSLSSIIFKANADEISSTRFYIITFIIVAGSFIISMTVTDLGTVFGFIGSTSSPTCILILPGLFYYYYKNKQNENENKNRCIDKINKYGSIITFTFGIILIPFSLFVFFV